MKKKKKSLAAKDLLRSNDKKNRWPGRLRALGKSWRRATLPYVAESRSRER